MVFDRDEDLTKDFQDLIGGKKGKSKVADFEFSEKNASSLDLGFDNMMNSGDPIEVGHKRAFGKRDKRKTKTIRPIKKGASFISEEF